MIKSMLAFLVIILTIQRTSAFTLSRKSPRNDSLSTWYRHVRTSGSTRFAAKGFGGKRVSGGGFGSESTAGSSKAVVPPRKPTKAAITKKIEKKYGGTTAKDIALGTQRHIEKAMRSLPPHLQMATQLYQELEKWNARLSSMSILQQATTPQSEIDGAQRVQEELHKICLEHNLTKAYLHNIFQRITWDASADAKAARAMTGTMPGDIAERIDKACRIVGETVRQSKSTKPRCLDVGCGFGVLVPHLIKAGGLTPSQIFGVDLSPEMIRNALEQHPREVTFEAADYLDEYSGPTDDDGMFDSIIFSSALHDLPDPIRALQKSASLLRQNGTIVIAHAQGASHVEKQVEANPILVRRCLPTSSELHSLASEVGLILDVEPAPSNTPQDVAYGYLAVLRKV